MKSNFKFNRLLAIVSLIVGLTLITPSPALALFDSPPLYNCGYATGDWTQTSIGFRCAWQTNTYTSYRVKATCTSWNGSKTYISGPWRSNGGTSTAYCSVGTVTAKSWQKS